MNHVKEFLSSSAKNDSTEVCSETAPEIVQANIKPSEQHENIEAVDRERHIHHHQHRVQPIVAQETLPTQHQHVISEPIVREHKHDMLPEHREKLEQQRTMYQPSETVNQVQRSEVALPAQANEHVHHHVHETIQPVIQKEVIQPSVVHHTHAVHEKVHDAPIVHEATTLPTVTLDEFKTKIGAPHSHKDQNHTHQFYDGAPRVGGQSTTGKPSDV